MCCLVKKPHDIQVSILCCQVQRPVADTALQRMTATTYSTFNYACLLLLSPH